MKQGGKCMMIRCGNRSVMADDMYCPKHLREVDARLAEIQQWKLWTRVCLICSRRDDVWIIPHYKDLLIRAGAVRCKGCGTNACGLEAFDYRDSDHETGVVDARDIPNVRLPA